MFGTTHVCNEMSFDNNVFITRDLYAKYASVNNLSVGGVPIQNLMQTTITPFFTFPDIHTTHMCELLLAHYFSNTPFVLQIQSIIVPWMSQHTVAMSKACGVPKNRLLALLFCILPECKTLFDKDGDCHLSTQSIETKIVSYKPAHIERGYIKQIIMIVTGSYGCLESAINVFIQADDNYKSVLTNKVIYALHGLWKEIPESITIDEK